MEKQKRSFVDWTQIIVLTVTITGLFIWNRSESRSDMRAMMAQIESNRISTDAIVTSIRDDIKDFHGRLCTIEERNRK